MGKRPGTKDALTDGTEDVGEAQRGERHLDLDQVGEGLLVHEILHPRRVMRRVCRADAQRVHHGREVLELGQLHDEGLLDDGADGLTLGGGGARRASRWRRGCGWLGGRGRLRGEQRVKLWGCARQRLALVIHLDVARGSCGAAGAAGLGAHDEVE
eukprot:4991513-Prymnesium_polylepis.2